MKAIKKLPGWLQVIALTSAVAAFIAALWGFGDTFGFRPALKAEVDLVASKVQVVATSVDWLELANYEKFLDRGGKLTRRECAKYTGLAKRLGVQPMPC